MEPTYYTGDLVVARCGEPQVGDVVVYEPTDLGGARIIHRIVGGDADDGWEMQGDNNDFVDPFTPRRRRAVARASRGSTSRRSRSPLTAHHAARSCGAASSSLALALLVWPRTTTSDEDGEPGVEPDVTGGPGAQVRRARTAGPVSSAAPWPWRRTSVRGRCSRAVASRYAAASSRSASSLARPDRSEPAARRAARSLRGDRGEPVRVDRRLRDVAATVSPTGSRRPRGSSRRWLAAASPVPRCRRARSPRLRLQPPGDHVARGDGHGARVPRRRTAVDGVHHAGGLASAHRTTKSRPSTGRAPEHVHVAERRRPQQRLSPSRGVTRRSRWSHGNTYDQVRRTSSRARRGRGRSATTALPRRGPDARRLQRRPSRRARGSSPVEPADLPDGHASRATARPGSTSAGPCPPSTCRGARPGGRVHHWSWDRSTWQVTRTTVSGSVYSLVSSSPSNIAGTQSFT